MTDRIEKANKTWRPFLAWGLALNTVLFPPALLAAACLGIGDPLLALIGLYGTVLAGSLGMAGVRQWQKNKLVDAGENITIAAIEEDDIETALSYASHEVMQGD